MLFTFVPAEPASSNHTVDENGSFFEFSGLGTCDILPGGIIPVTLGGNATAIFQRVGKHYEIVDNAYIRMYMHRDTLVGYL